MLSTHWRTPHEPTERDLHLLDMLVRQAADLIKHRQDEEALRESERRYRELFESMTEGFCVIERVDTDPDEPVDFRYVEANPAFAEHSGIGDVVGQTMREVIPGEAPEWIEIYDTVLQTEEANRFERELVAEDRTLELYAFQVGDGTDERVGVIFQDITERKQRREALEEAHNQLQAATTAGSVGLWTWNVRADSLTADEYVAESYGLDPETTATGASIETFIEQVHEDDRDCVRAQIERAVEETGNLDTEYRVRNATGDTMWLVLRGEVEYDETGEALRVYGAISDITERKRTTQAVERLNEISRELMGADLETISARAAEIVWDVLDVEYATLWRYNQETGEFRRHSNCTSSHVEPDTIQVSDDCADRVWQTFISNEIDVSNHLSSPESTKSSHPLRSDVLVPLAKHGVVRAGSLQTDTFDEPMVDLAGTTAATLETALNRAAGEQQLAQQNEELARLDRLNSLIRAIDQALVQADSLAVIDRAVCERLAASEHYAFAWIGDLDPGTETITPRAWAGVDSSYVDTLTADDTTIDGSPFVRAVRTKETQVVEDLATETHFAPLRKATLERGARSYIGVPLVYDETLYGVLSIYGDDPQFDTDDHAVLSELGRTIAHAINAVETRETLRTDRVVELTLECRKPHTPLCRLSQQTGCTIDFEGLVRRSGGEPEVFFTAKDVSADELHAAGEASVAITELLCLTDGEDGSLFRARVTEPTLASRCINRDAVVRTLTIEEGRATVVVDLPHTASVREFIDRLQQTAPDVELRARRTRDRPFETQRTFQAICEERLTAKQHAALQTAYLSGFFESPRVRTGKEVAASLDISQPTFTNHLRAAQRGVYELLFEDDRRGAIQ
jgi:PAS domain S-box-containing protein